MTTRPGRGLGRGLASLIPDSALELDVAPAEPRGESLKTVPIQEIQPNPEQPRSVFDKEALDELAASIRIYGILSPLVVRKSEGRYILIAGERRLRAAGLAGLKEVPVVVKDADEAKHQLEIALVENLQRTDLDPVEMAKGFQRLVEVYGYTQDAVATAVGKDRSTIANMIRLTKLPDFVLAALQESKITAGHAKAMLPLTDEDQLRTVLGKIVEHGLNVRQTERLVADLMKVAPAVPLERSSNKSKAFDYAIKILEEALHTTVAIKASPKGGGRIMVDYANGEDLERLISLLRRGEA